MLCSFTKQGYKKNGGNYKKINFGWFNNGPQVFAKFYEPTRIYGL